MTTELRAAVSALIATARSAHPACPDWQLTMNPETFRTFDPDRVATSITEQHVATFHDGCRIWAQPTWADAVVCSPLVASGTWDLPDEYYLDLRDDSISTHPPMHAMTIRGAHGSLGSEVVTREVRSASNGTGMGR